MKKIPLVSKCFLVILGLLICSIGVFAEIPKTINVQGKLTTDSGGPITGNKDIYLKIYNGSQSVATSSAAVIVDSDGIYNANIPVGNVNFNTAYTFEVEVKEGNKTIVTSSRTDLAHHARSQRMGSGIIHEKPAGLLD